MRALSEHVSLNGVHAKGYRGCMDVPRDGLVRPMDIEKAELVWTVRGFAGQKRMTSSVNAGSRERPHRYRSIGL